MLISTARSFLLGLSCLCVAACMALDGSAEPDDPAESTTTQALSCRDTHTIENVTEFCMVLGQDGTRSCTRDTYIDREWVPPGSNDCRIVDQGVNVTCTPCVRSN